MSSRRTETVERLSRALRQREQARRVVAPGVFSTGIPPLDELLPDGGLRPGMLVEWLAARSGSGAGTLALRIAAALSGGFVEQAANLPSPREAGQPFSCRAERGEGPGVRGKEEQSHPNRHDAHAPLSPARSIASAQDAIGGEGRGEGPGGSATHAPSPPAPLPRHRPLCHPHDSRGRGEHAASACVVVDRQRSWYAPAAAALGLDLDATIVVHPANPRDELWALEQSLRCHGVSVVLAWPGRLRSDDFRRLQLAGEHGGGIGLLLRSARHRREASWADLRLLVEPLCGVTTDRRVARPDHRDGRGERYTERTTAELAWPALFSLTPGPSPAMAFFPQSPLVAGERGECVDGGSPPGRWLRVELVHCRGRFGGGAVILEIDDETGVVRGVSRVAPATAVRRAAGA